MMNRQEITKMAKRILKGDRGLRTPQIMHPKREWFIGLVVAIAIFGASAVWSTHTYLAYKNVSVTTNDSAADDPVAYRASLVEGALAEFASRAETYDMLVQNAMVNSAPEEPTGTTSTSTTATTTEPTPQNERVEVSEQAATNTPEATTTIEAD